MALPMSSHEVGLSQDPADRCQQVLRTQQLIVFALFAGPLVLLLLFIVLVNLILNPLAPNILPPVVNGLPTLSLIGLVMMALSVVISTFVPSLMTRQGLKALDDGPDVVNVPVPEDHVTDFTWARGAPLELIRKLLDLFQAQTLNRIALIEGGVVTGSVFYLLEGNFFVLVTAALGLLLMVLNYPTAASLNRWLRRQIKVLQGKG